MRTLLDSGGQLRTNWPFFITHLSVSYKYRGEWKNGGRWKKIPQFASMSRQEVTSVEHRHRASIVWSRHALSSLYQEWEQGCLKPQILEQLRRDLEEAERHIASLEQELKESRQDIADIRHRWDDLCEVDFQDDIVLEVMTRNRARIVRAIEAAENGEFGICKVCGCYIDSERLRALPSALTCIAHAE
mgnify:FL=1